MKDLIVRLRAIASIDRLRIINLFLKKSEVICVCELCAALRLPFYSVSRHLRELKMAGLLSEQRDGRYIYYKLCKDNLNDQIFQMLSALSDPVLFNDLENFRFRNDLQLCK